MREKINKIIVICCYIVFILATLLMGSPLKENFSIVNLLISIIAILYFIINKDKKIFDDLTDIMMLVFCVSSIIPAIFQKAINMGETINTFFYTISIFWIYIIIKNTMTTEKRKNIFIHVSILCSIFLVIYGIDDLAFNYLEVINGKLNLISIYNQENRMVSTAGYANSLAAILGFNIFLTLHCFLKNKKSVYVIPMFILISGLLLTLSKAAILLIIFTFFLLLFLIKERYKTIEILEILSISTILGIIFIKFFYELQEKKLFYIIWLLFVILAIFAWIIQLIIKKCNTKMFKISTKYFILLGVLILIFVLIIFYIGLKEEPLVINNEEETISQKRVQINGIQPNTQYCFEFDIQAYTNEEDNVYNIVLTEENKYADIVARHSVEFGSFKGKQKIEFLSSNETTIVFISFINAQNNTSEDLIINGLRINGKKEILNYKWIPTNLVKKIESLKYENKSIFERLTFLKDGMKIVQKVWLTGGGTNCWEIYYPEVQEYKYDAKQMHSFPIKVWMESGIVGIFSYCSILILVIIRTIKKRKNVESILLYIAILFLHVHSFIDFNLSFKYIFLIAFIFIAILPRETDKMKTVKVKSLNLLWIPIIVICCYYNVVNCTLEWKKSKISIQEAEFYLNIVPYNEDMIEIKMNQILSQNILDSEECEELKKYIEKQYVYKPRALYKLIKSNPSEENIDFCYNRMKLYLERQNLDLQKKHLLNDEILKISQKLEGEPKIKFCELLKEYKEKEMAELKNYEKNRYSKQQIQYYEELLNKIYLEAEEITK